MTVYQRAKAAGLEIDRYESDLHIKVTPESEKFIAELMEEGFIIRQFHSDDGSRWYDFPFLFDPFWEDKYKKRGAAENV